MKSRFYTAIKIDINCDYVIKKESLNKWDDKAVTGEVGGEKSFVAWILNGFHWQASFNLFIESYSLFFFYEV